MTYATIAVYLNQPLNISPHLRAALTLDDQVLVYVLTDTTDFIIGQVTYLRIARDLHSFAETCGCRAADTVDVAKRDVNLLITRNVHS